MKLPLRVSVILVVTSYAILCASQAASAPPQTTAPPRENGVPTVPQFSASSAASSASIMIPGPLRSVLRMAAVSQKVPEAEVMPLLARNVVVKGYRGWENKKPTEYLVLLRRYLDQARELMALAGPGGVIRISECSQAKPLLAILGYRQRETCGQKDNSLETDDAERAFLTIDSGFPLADLEDMLRGGKPFEYPFSASPVPALFTPEEWTAFDTSREKKDNSTDLLDTLLRNPELARLYWAMARMDEETRNTLRQTVGLGKLLPQAPALDFYGTYLRIRSGKVVLPGGAAAETAWKTLVGVSPDSPGEFVVQLMARDDAWLASYYDAVSRVNQSQQAYFAEPRRLLRLYQSLRGKEISPSPARPVFRPNPGLFLLMTRLQVDSSEQAKIPGGMDAWKEILRRDRDSKLAREWARRARGWKQPEELLEAMVALARERTDNGLLQVYLTLSEIDRGRSEALRLTPQTVRLLAENFQRYNHQYRIFAEFSGLDNTSITRFMKVAEGMDKVSNRILRANALGIFQANIGIWQILARQGQIPKDALNSSWQRIIESFSDIRSSEQLFDAGQAALSESTKTASGRPQLSQDELITLLAGPNPSSPEEERVRQELAARMRAVMDGQRLVSLNTLVSLNDGLKEMAQGKRSGTGSLISMAGELREFEMPQPLFTSRERVMWASGLHSRRHTEAQMKTDLSKTIRSEASPKEVAEARGQLTPFLRDTLVGLNYAYYEPPGAQMLHNNPLFVRSHDFSGDMTLGGEQSWQTARLFGAGMSAGGGAHLVGSLSDLPYVLAQAEQDFLVPENVQALIWQELVPTILTSAVLPRWWGVTRNQMRAVTLHQRTGEELLAAAVSNEQLRGTVMSIMSEGMLPQRAERLEAALRGERLQEVMAGMMPSDTFYLASEFRRKHPGQMEHLGEAGKQLEQLTRSHPDEVAWERLSSVFGVPHPVLAQSYSRELLNVKPFPAFMGYASRLLAESWDSNNLYWTRLADEMGYSPAMLNRLVPELTHRMVEKIFATDFEDWPALLRAMRETGEEFRRGRIAGLPASGATARP